MRGETRDGLASVEPPPIPTSDQPNTKPKPKRAKRSPPPEVPLPAGWAPSAELLSWARNTQAVALPEAVVYAEADKFRDRALAKGTEHVDWDAAFRTWLRNARKYDPSLPRALPIPPGGPPPLPPPRPEIAEAAAQLELDSTPRDYRDALRGFGTLGGGQT